MKIKLLGTDEFKENFVAFYINRGDYLNAYIWVYEDGRVRITDIYGMASYCNQALSPIYVGSEMPEDFVGKASEVLKGMEKEKMDKLLDRFNKRDEELREHDEESYKEREEYEDGVFEEIRAKREDPDGAVWFM